MIQTDRVGLSYRWKINNLHQTNKSRITWKKSLSPWPCLTDDLWKKTGIIKLDDLRAVYIIQEKWNVKIKFLPARTKDRSQKNTSWNADCLSRKKTRRKVSEKIPLTKFCLMARKASPHSRCWQLYLHEGRPHGFHSYGILWQLAEQQPFNVLRNSRQDNTALTRRFQRQQCF